MTARRNSKPVSAKSTAAKRGAQTRAANKATQQPTVGLNVVNRYDAAGNGRRLAGWRPPSSGPNRALQGIETIRNRAQDSVRNDWSGSAGVRRWTATLIGTGITPRFSSIKDKDKRKFYTQQFKDWIKVCDAEGVLDYYAQQTLATRTWFIGGEAFGRLRFRRLDSGLVIPLQIQALEGDMVPYLDADVYPGLPFGNRIRSGIELNRIGQRVAVWFYREHPGDDSGRLTSADASKLVRVPIDEVLHLFEPLRPGQLRGVPDQAPVLVLQRTIADYQDAVLDRQKLANLITGFITQSLGSGVDDSVDPLTGKPIQTDSSGMDAIGWEPGTLQQLAPGEDVKFSNPPEAGTTYSDYIRTQNMGVAAGQNIPYELLTGDIKEVSDRTLRVVVNEFRRFAEQRQWNYIIPMWAQRIIEAWVDTGVIAGVVDLADAPLLKQVEHQPDGWAYIHPVQDVQAKIAEVDARLRSRSSVIAERGDDPEDVDDEIAADQEREEALGIAPINPAQPGSQQGNQQQPDGDNIAPGEYPRNRALDNLTATVARLQTTVEDRSERQSEMDAFTASLTRITTTLSEVTAAVAALAAKPVPAPVVNNHLPAPTVVNNVEPTPVTVTTTVEPPVVNVENTVNPTPVEITNKVEGTTVVNNVDVPPAEVTVKLPDRKITSDIKHDPNGRITNVTQVEKTLQ